MTNSDSSILNLKVWFEQALTWLMLEKSAADIQNPPPYQQMLKLMEDARRENHLNQVWDLLAEMEEYTLQTTGTLEHGEIYIQCAKMAVELENLKDGMRLCLAAESKYLSYPHQHAVAHWMIGCMHWVNHQRVKAVSGWQEALRIFRIQQVSLQNDSFRGRWYQIMIPVLESYLKDAINNDTLPRYMDVPPTQTSSSEKRTAGEPSDFIEWQGCPVNDSVPAGEFGAVGTGKAGLSYLQISEVLIENERFKVFSMKRSSLWQNKIPLSSSTNHKVVRVTGNSMNMATPVTIKEGDYILVQVQSSAQDNDIVIVGILDIDILATVKRFKRIGNKIQLIPESSDPTYKSHPDFERLYAEGEVNILGVVKAVFKKLNDNRMNSPYMI